MMTTVTHNEHDTATHATEPVWFLAFALREKTWQLGFTPGHGQKPRARTMAARDLTRLRDAVAQATSRCGLCDTAPVVSCDAAGRAGCWRHRFLPAQGITTQVVDSSAIAVHRRRRRAKRDGVDVRKLVRRLRRFHSGDRQVWRVVQVPAVEAEEQRPLQRDVETLQQERARTTTRIKGVLRSQGVRLTSLRQLPAPLDALRLWDGSPLPRGLRRRVLRVYAHHQLLREQMAAVEAERRAMLHTSTAAPSEKVRQLMHRRGIGINGAGLLVRALFGGRACKHRREGGGLAGVTPTPYHRGESAREHGLTKAGNRHVRWRTTEWAWSGVRDQPESARSGWFRERFGRGGTRLRRIGMVAVARQLLMALWRFLQTGVVPEGAVLTEA
jgi:transposase